MRYVNYTHSVVNYSVFKNQFYSEEFMYLFDVNYLNIFFSSQMQVYFGAMMSVRRIARKYFEIYDIPKDLNFMNNSEHVVTYMDNNNNCCYKMPSMDLNIYSKLFRFTSLCAYNMQKTAILGKSFYHFRYSSLMNCENNEIVFFNTS